MNEGVVGDGDRDHRRRDPEQPHFICDQLAGSISRLRDSGGLNSVGRNRHGASIRSPASPTRPSHGNGQTAIRNGSGPEVGQLRADHRQPCKSDCRPLIALPGNGGYPQTNGG
jgi:hypothetical protein